MDVSALVAEFGSYYSAEGQNMMNLMSMLRQGSETASILAPINTKNTQTKFALSTFGRVVQPFKADWSPTDPLVMDPHYITKYRLKVDEELAPDEATHDTYLGFLEAEGLDRSQWPFIRWYVEKELMPQIIEDIELNEIWSGVYAAPAAGATPGAAGTSMNGLAKQITDGITAGLITPITVGAWSATDSTFVEQLEDMAQGINEIYRQKPYTIHMNATLYTRFLKGYEDLYGQIQNYDGFKPKLRFTNWNVKGLVSMGSSQRVWASLPGNAVKVQNRLSNMQKFHIKEDKRQVAIFTDFDLGVGFKDPRQVFVNDQV